MVTTPGSQGVRSRVTGFVRIGHDAVPASRLCGHSGETRHGCSMEAEARAA
jgi:hypothetical protein